MKADFKKIFGFEIKRLLSRVYILTFVSIILLTLIAVHFGIVDFLAFKEDVEIFQKEERERVYNYLFYSQYGGFGIRLLFVPGSLCVFSNDSNASVMISNVNTADRLKIYKPTKGKSFFESSGFMDFSGIIYIFGCFFSFLYGFDAFGKKDFIKLQSYFMGDKRLFIYIGLSRIILISLLFGVLVIISIILILSSSISINIQFLWFVLTGFLLLIISFSGGLLIGSIRNRIVALGVLGVVYFAVILLIPWICQKILNIDASRIESLFNFQLENMRIYTTVEKKLINRLGILKRGDSPSPEQMKEFIKILNDDYKLIFDRENKRKLCILKKIRNNQTISSFFPATFYLSVKKEVSSTGFLNAIDFYTFSQEKKIQFLEYYIQKMALSKNKPGKVKNFIKGDENLFFAKSRLPYRFGLGVGLTVLYIIGLLFWSYRLHIRRLKKEESKIDFSVNFEQGKNTVFVLCKDEAIKRGIFNHYKQKDAVCIAKINPDDFRMNGIKPADLLNHLSRVAGVDEKRARENLGIMGGDIDTIKTGLRVFRGNSYAAEKEKSNELILKIYAAVMTAGDHSLIVIDDFLKRESRQFESDLVELFSTLLTSGKKIIYLSTEMYQTANRFEDKIKIDKFGNFPILDTNIKQISLR